jgi:hypothetical protein
MAGLGRKRIHGGIVVGHRPRLLAYVGASVSQRTLRRNAPASAVPFLSAPGRPISRRIFASAERACREGAARRVGHHAGHARRGCAAHGAATAREHPALVRSDGEGNARRHHGALQPGLPQSSAGRGLPAPVWRRFSGHAALLLDLLGSGRGIEETWIERRPLPAVDRAVCRSRVRPGGRASARNDERRGSRHAGRVARYEYMFWDMAWREEQWVP